jgi:hypothetical protein
MLHQATEHAHTPQALDALASAANKSTYIGAATAAVGGISASDIAAFGGLALAAAGFVINTFFRWRDDRRAQQESEQRMRLAEATAVAAGVDRRCGLPDTRSEPVERRQQTDRRAAT